MVEFWLSFFVALWYVGEYAYYWWRARQAVRQQKEKVCDARDRAIATVGNEPDAAAAAVAATAVSTACIYALSTGSLFVGLQEKAALLAETAEDPAAIAARQQAAEEEELALADDVDDADGGDDDGDGDDGGDGETGASKKKKKKK